MKLLQKVELIEAFPIVGFTPRGGYPVIELDDEGVPIELDVARHEPKIGDYMVRDANLGDTGHWRYMSQAEAAEFDELEDAPEEVGADEES
jgi:hypothetical protein